MTGRPVAALTESVARQIVREHNGNRDRIAVALAEEVTARGGWKASTCQPLLRAFELATPSPATPEGEGARYIERSLLREETDPAPSTLPAETREGRRDAIAEVLFQHDLGINTCECTCGGWDADSSEETFEQHQADALLAASPAVSLPIKEEL